MSVSKHNGLYSVGDIVGNPGSYSMKFYGYKLLQKVWVEQIQEYIWLGQYGAVATNKFVADEDGETITSLTNADIKSGYESTWTPEPEFAKGDILTGKGGGKVMLFVYISDSHVERLTPRSDVWGGEQFGYSTLSDYSKNFGPLEVHTVQGYQSSRNGEKFSAL